MSGLLDPPRGFDLTGSGNEIRIHFRHPGRCPQRIRNFGCLETFGGIALFCVIYMTWFYAGFPVSALAPKQWGEAVFIAFGMAPVLLILLGMALVYRKRRVTLVITAGELRIDGWHRPLRELNHVSHHAQTVSAKGRSHVVHSVRIPLADETWQISLPDDEEGARWLANVIQTRRRAALSDTGKPPEALVDLTSPHRG